MFEYLGWEDAGQLIRDAVEDTIDSGTVTYDLARQREDAEKVSTTEYAEAVVDRIEELA
jgi:isocitrate dehydrogenase